MDLRRLLDLYDVGGTQRGKLEQSSQSAGQRGWWDAYSDTLGPEYTALIALEAEAESVRWYAPMLVPGLLQTEQYARAVISSGLLIAPPGEVERRVQVKMTRQRVLTRDNPLSLDLVLDEAAVLRTISGLRSCRSSSRTWSRWPPGPTSPSRCSRWRRGAPGHHRQVHHPRLP